MLLFLFLSPHVVSPHLFDLSLLFIVVTQIRGHIAGRLTSPFPTTVRAFVSVAKNLQPFLPLSISVELRLCDTITGDHSK